MELKNAKVRVVLHYFDVNNKLIGSDEPFEYGGNSDWPSVHVKAIPPVNTMWARVHFNILAIEDNASRTVIVDSEPLQSKKNSTIVLPYSKEKKGNQKMDECIKRVTYLFLISLVCFTISCDSHVMASMSRELNDFSYVIESFERGDLNQTNYIAGAGRITSNPLQVITGKHSVYVESSPKEEWKDAIYTNANKVHIEKNTTYAVTFSYKSIVEPVQVNNGYFYFTARGVGSDYKSDKGWTEWTGQAGKMGTKTITFKTGEEENYFLIWGIHNGGSLSLDDISIQKLSESFERGDLNQTNYIAGAGRITSDPQQIITGKHSVYVESSPKEEWKDAIYTNANKVHFEKNTTYAVTFSYKSIVEPVQGKNGYFYFTARGVGSGDISDKGWTEWTGQSGKSGTKTITFKTGDEENYFLIWGIHNGGALSLDDIMIKKDEYQYDANGRLGRVYLPGNVEIKYFYDANGNLMRRERSN